MDFWLTRWLEQNSTACPVCGKSLGIPERAECPHCGAGIALGLTIPQPYLRAWGVCLAGVAVAAGLGLFLDLLVLVRGTHLLRTTGCQFIAVLAPVLGLSIACLLRWRPRFCRLPAVWQRALAGGALTLAALTAVGFAISIWR